MTDIQYQPEINEIIFSTSHLWVVAFFYRVGERMEAGCTFDFLSVPSPLLIYKWQLGVVRGQRRHGGEMGAGVKVL